MTVYTPSAPSAPGRPAAADPSDRLPTSPDSGDAIRVVLADGNPLYREGLTDLLAARAPYRVVAGVDQGEAAVEACRAHQPDLLLIELRLGGLQAEELIERVREASQSIRVVAFSQNLDPPAVWRALRSGADGLLSKDATLDELLSAMRAVHDGDVYLCSQVQHLLVRRALRQGEQGGAGRWAQLSPREREVAEHLVEGKSPRQIAERMSLKTKTVDSHRYQLLHKLGLRNVADLTRLAVYEGVISV